MDYYGLLFLYYLKGLSGKSILRLFFNIEAGGTEQLLPENTSVPTTTPILADIQYPDGLRTDQYFTYRETPTTVSNKARIKTIKGNTLVWNQLVGTNVNGLSEIQGTTFSLNSNGSIHVTGTGTGNHFCEWRTYENPSFVMVKGHKYLAAFKGLTNGIIAQVSVYTTASTYLLNKIDLVGSYAEIVTPTQDGITSSLIRFYTTNTFSGSTDITMQLFDLTQMGLGSITSVDEFTSLFPLSYYAYNQGTLLSFNGNGIKTVGKNLFDFSQFANGTITFENGVLNGTGAQFHTAYGTYATAKKLNCPRGSQITISFDAWTDQNASSTGNGLIIVTYHYDGTHEDAMVPNATGTPRHFTLQRQDIEKIGWSYGTQGANRWHIENFQVEFGATETSYEPYTSSTSSLPISTYFPNGMKSAGTVYDELTPTKGITRIGAVDLGSLTWNKTSGSTSDYDYFETASSITTPGGTLNVLCPLYKTVNAMTSSSGENKAVRITGTSNIRIRDLSFTDISAFTSAMSGVYLYYELATPTETPITTEDANEALSLLMGKTVSSNNANQLIDIITKGE